MVREDTLDRRPGSFQREIGCRISRRSMRFVWLLLLYNLALSAADWPSFRGPNGAAVSEAHGLPMIFGPKSNLLWKITVPAGSSSPIVEGDRVWLAGYEDNRLLLWCLDRITAKVIWERALEQACTERKTFPNDPASSTPATDGQNVYALFSGFGLVSYSMDGKERWRTPL